MRATLALLAAAALALGAVAPAAAAEIVIGAQCDRTGPTQTVGTNLCPGFNDYIKLVNMKGGVNDAAPTTSVAARNGNAMRWFMGDASGWMMRNQGGPNCSHQT